MADDVPDTEKTARIVALQALQRGIQTGLLATAVGATLDVLVDSAGRRRARELSGRTGSNVVVSFDAPADMQGDDTPDAAWFGRTVPVRILRAGPYSLWGEVAE
jgi:tRNA A37 methylthiotransferase MiaB